VWFKNTMNGTRVLQHGTNTLWEMINRSGSVSGQLAQSLQLCTAFARVVPVNAIQNKHAKQLVQADINC
jgi:hypothetical protein